MIRSVLTVCIGNICRSPMAEVLLRAELPALSISSAGLAAPIGSPADPIALRLMSSRGLDLDQHRAKRLLPSHVAAADLILVMDLEQKDIVEREHPLARGKIYRLGKADIFDPYRLGSEEFVKCLSLIDRGIQEWVQRIKAIS